jgi:hypothetical protein
MVDFGAESSFTRAAARLAEHYHIEVPRSALYLATLRHGRAMGGGDTTPAAPATCQLITQIDGSMIPIVNPGKGLDKGPDKRKGKTLRWGEVRLCSARVPGQCEPV